MLREQNASRASQTVFGGKVDRFLVGHSDNPGGEGEWDAVAMVRYPDKDIHVRRRIQRCSTGRSISTARPGWKASC